jgi:hypothetical protein
MEKISMNMNMKASGSNAHDDVVVVDVGESVSKAWPWDEESGSSNDAASASKPQISSPSRLRAQKLIASASDSEKRSQGKDKELISSDEDGIVFNADEEAAEVVGCTEANDEDDHNDRGVPTSNCVGGSTNYKYKFSLSECGFPDMVEDVTATMSSDLQDLKLRLWQEQEQEFMQ